MRQVLPKRYHPSIGLRPGAAYPALEPLIVVFYAAMYESVAAHSRLGLNVVVDVGHHDAYSKPLGILYDSARRLEGLPALFVGVRCPIDVIIERRRNTWDERGPAHHPVPQVVHLWQRAVHTPGIDDLEVDTSMLSPEECAKVIQKGLENGPPPSAYQRLAVRSGEQD